MIDPILFCFACWSNMTRLLKIPIVARAGFASTSSCIDKLGGESRACTRNTPPGFWAKPAWLADIATSSAPSVVSMRKCPLIGLYLLFESGLSGPPSRPAAPLLGSKARRRRRGYHMPHAERTAYLGGGKIRMNGDARDS